MSIALNHTIINVRDKRASADFFTQLFGLPEAKPFGSYFLSVELDNGVTLDFCDADYEVEKQHYAFLVGDAEFDAIFGRIREAGIVYRSRPMGPDDMKINTRLGGRNVYWNDADGHIWEILTVSYARPRADAG